MARILVVDDNEDMLDTLEHLFKFYEFEVIRARNGKEAVEIARNEVPDLIVLDALMPVMNGFEACKVLKETPETKQIPVVFLSANYTEEEHRVHGLELGADDYIIKPFNAKELIAKVRGLLNKKKLIDDLQTDREKLLQQQNAFTREMEKIKSRARELSKVSFLDPLTGVYSEAFVARRLQEEMDRARRYQQPVSLVLLDVNQFRAINDVFGHEVGDYLLSKLAQVIRENTRSTDVVFKLNGDRFLILLPNTEETGAYYEAERVRSAVEQTNFFAAPLPRLKQLSKEREKEFQKVTLNAGVCQWEESVENPRAWLGRAEKALQRARSQGRNRTERYSRIEQPSQTGNAHV